MDGGRLPTLLGPCIALVGYSAVAIMSLGFSIARLQAHEYALVCLGLAFLIGNIFLIYGAVGRIRRKPQ